VDEQVGRVTLSGGRRLAGYLLATAGTGALVAILLPLRDDVDALSMGWAFLGLVVLATVVGGLGPGLTASILAFAAYNLEFFPPYHTLRVQEPEHVIVLFAFLGSSVLIATLLGRARARAAAAEARGRELALQQDLAVALVDPSPGNEHALAALRLAAARWGLDRVDLYATGPTGSGLDLLVTTAPGAAPAVPPPADVGLARFPLVVGRRAVGLLVVYGHRPPLDAAETRALTAFGDQLALVLERDRLLRASVEGQLEERTTAP